MYCSSLESCMAWKCSGYLIRVAVYNYIRYVGRCCFPMIPNFMNNYWELMCCMGLQIMHPFLYCVYMRHVALSPGHSQILSMLYTDWECLGMRLWGRYKCIRTTTFTPPNSNGMFKKHTKYHVVDSLKEVVKVDELSLGGAEREDGLGQLCHVLIFSFGARHEGLSRTKLEDVPQVLLKLLAMLLDHLGTLQGKQWSKNRYCNQLVYNPSP